MTCMHGVVFCVSLVLGESFASDNGPTPQSEVAERSLKSDAKSYENAQELHEALLRLDYSTVLASLSELAETNSHDKIVVVLRDRVSDRDPRVRWQAVRALGRLGAKGKPATRELIAALKDSDPLVRWAAADALVTIGPDAEASLPALIEGLSAADPLTRRSCAMILAKIGPDARSAVPALFDALRDKDTLVRRRAAQALREIFQLHADSLPEYRDLLTEDLRRNQPNG
ncbi:MAG: HEAT repeat domain-containing protein [Planctomycetota bacterium]